MDFKPKSSSHYQNGNNFMEQQHRSPYNEMSTNQSLLHHINTPTTNKHQEQHQQHLDAHDYQNQQKYHQTMFVKNHYHSPKSRHMRRRARSECLSPSRSPQHYPQQQYPDRYNLKTPVSNGFSKDHQADLWRMHRREEQINNYREYQHEMHQAEAYKNRFHHLQIDGKSVQLEEIEPAHDEANNYSAWHQRRRSRASSESASHDYYFRESYPDDDIRVKRTREALNSPVKERRSTASHHVTNPRNSFSVLVNNTAHHYRYSPKTKVRSHYVGHKVGVVRVSSPLHKARMQMWKSQSSSSTSNSIPSTESRSTPETPQVDDDDDDSDDDSDDEEEPQVYGGEHAADDDMTDPEDNYESSLSISSSERSLAMPAPTINTDCVQGGRVLSAPFAPSLFPFVPPYITFATFEEKGPDMPAMIHKQLKWKLTTITPLLVRKVLLNTGFRLMKSEYNAS
jgi:hypothetical protein